MGRRGARAEAKRKANALTAAFTAWFGFGYGLYRSKVLVQVSI